MSDPRFTLAIHGGAGTIRADALTPQKARACRAGLAAALRAGGAVLADGGTALDAVVAAVMALEDDPLFNAGRGAVFTDAGTQEMDAAIMDGRNRAAGAVTGIFGPRNPVQAARLVMERTPHVMLTGAGALALCRAHGLPFAGAEWFHTEARWQALETMRARRAEGLGDGQDAALRHGTVGAVARDRHGNLAAATSTGGMTGKAPGRVGDSPVIGAGTWACNATCAVSGTGHGEVFIRYAAAHEIDARMRWGGQTLAEAAEAVVHELLAPNDGSGGLIAVDAAGHAVLPFNSEGMYRGLLTEDGVARVAIHHEALAAPEG